MPEDLQRVLKPPFRFNFGRTEENPARAASATPQSNCILDVSKLLNTGVKIRPVTEAVKESLDRMRLALRSLKGAAALVFAGLAGCCILRLWT